MEARRVLLLFTLLQGVFTFSPIPPELGEEAHSEWETYTAMLRDPAYRLPTTTYPRHYEVSLRPYFENVPTGVSPFTFDGEVTIYLSPAEANVNEIVMHCNDLTIYSVVVTTIVNGVVQNVPTTGGVPTCESPYDFLRITTTAALQVNQEYIVTMTFLGNIQSTMRGFYRSYYTDNSTRRWMGTTQFQPSHARQAFPCYDEPGFKATFDITIIRESDFSPTISNMPIRNQTVLADGRVSETFYTTPVTSTYLLAFIVSHYEMVATNGNETRPFDIYARNNVGSTGDWALEIGELLLEAMETYTGIPYYDMAENMNMKQAAIPDFSAGAMENWGLLTYREALILYDPLNSNHFYRQRVANIVAHEIAHMWFGNLVTCAWWDNLWLNEGFARFYQYFLTGSVAEELGYPTRFIVEQVHVSLLSDSVDSAHPLTDPNVNEPAAVSAHFSTITYAKGASVLRMTQYLLGESTYLTGLRTYLSERQYDVAEPQHLFDALDRAASENGALSAYPGITINSYLLSWSEKAGHPLLTVTIDQATGQMIVTQARWERDTGVSVHDSIWEVPITWTRESALDFENLKPTQVITNQVTVLNRGTTGQDWVIFNKQQSGFYRVNYDDNNWGLITRVLRSTQRTTIHEYNRAQIVDDVFALARAGVMTYTRALNILSFLEFEDAYAPWIAAITGFNFMIGRVAYDTQSLENLQQEIIKLSTAVTSRLGYSEVASESYMDGLQRMYVMDFLCNVGHPECVSNGISNFQNWRNNVFLPANMRSWVYCTGLREGTAEDYNALWNHYVQEDLASEKVVVLGALGCTKDNASLWNFMDNIIADTDDVRAQDYTTAIYSAIYSNEDNPMIIFEWLKNNVNETMTTLGSLATPISYIAARLRNENQLTEFETWLQDNQAAIGTAYSTGINGIQTTRNNMAWTTQRVPEIQNYLDVGYVDGVIDIDEEEQAPEEIDVIEPEPEELDPDSANIVALSIVTLALTLGINFMV